MRLHEQALIDAKARYDDSEIRKLAQTAARVEAAGYCQWSRVEETMEFARRLAVEKIGIAFCGGLWREARTAAEIFEKNGFDVASARCKVGSIRKEELELKDHDKVRPGTMEHACNPVGQAEILNTEKTGLNVIIGLCVGHDSLFIKHSKAPVTCLIAKDRVLAHNPVGALYNASSYYNQKLFEAHK